MLAENLVGEQLAWALAHGASKDRKLLAQAENYTCPGRPDGGFFQALYKWLFLDFMILLQEFIPEWNL